MNNPCSGKSEDVLGESTTNVFALADVWGLKWKKYTSNVDSSVNIFVDPVLSAYAVALRNDLCCVWQRVESPGMLSCDESGSDLLSCFKELVIFWYGEEPQLYEFPGQHLKEVESGSYDHGLPPEYQDLFFKALHNLIEKSLISSGFVRLGQWFTQPVENCANTGDRLTMSSLAFSFNFFICGASLVATSVDMCFKHANRSICKSDVASLVGANVDATKVLLSPYGLNAELTGGFLHDTDAQSSKIMDEWRRFFPMPKSQSVSKEGLLKSETCPAVVEVIMGDMKMYYPSCLVLLPVTSSNGKGGLPVLTPPASPPMLASVAKDNKLDTRNISTSSKSYAKKQSTPVSSQNPSSVLLHHIWESADRKDLARSSPSIKVDSSSNSSAEPLWDFKKCMRQTACGCSTGGNAARPKPVAKLGNSTPSRPGSSSLSPSCPGAALGTPRPKWERTLVNFHQRSTRAERIPSHSGRATPALLSGRSTPSGMAKMVAPQKPGLLEMPVSVQKTAVMDARASVSVDELASVGIEASSVSTKKASEFTSASPTKSVPVLLSQDLSKQMSLHAQAASSAACFSQKPLTCYRLPDSLYPPVPRLPGNPLDPRVDERHTLHIGPPPSVVLPEVGVFPGMLPAGQVLDGGGVEMKIERVPNQSVKRGSKSSLSGEEHVAKKVKPAPLIIEGSATGRKSRRGSHVGQVQSPQLLSPDVFAPVFEDEVLSPSARKKGSNGRCRESPLSSPVPDSPICASGSAKAARRGRKNSGPPVKTPGTPKGESAFLFGPTKSHAASPPTPHFPPTPKSGTSWMSTKDLVANCEDLEHLFEGSDDEETGLKKVPTRMQVPELIQGPPSLEDATSQILTSHTFMASGGGLTQQDLQQMFPTPPSLEPASHAMSPGLMVPLESSQPSAVSLCAAAPSMSLVSRDRRMTNVNEKDAAELRREYKVAQTLPTYDMPKMQAIPIADVYSPLQLPSQKSPLVTCQYVKYHMSWESRSKPPVLSRRPSGNRSLPRMRSDDALLMTTCIASIDAPVSLPLTGHLLQASAMTSFNSVARSSVSNAVVSPPPYGQVRSHDFRSLIINLSIGNSHPNSSLVENLAYDVKDTTLRNFSVYQNTLWKCGLLEELGPNLFVGDSATRPYRSRSALSVVPLDEKPSTVTLISVEFVTALSSSLSSYVSVSHMKKILDLYYVRNKKLISDEVVGEWNVLKVELLNGLFSHLQGALRRSIRKNSWELPAVEGPLSFQLMQRMACKQGFQSRSSPCPLLVCCESEAVSLAPFSLSSWMQLSLEPYAGVRHVAYMVISPETDFVSSHVRKFFRELSAVYEALNLGSHCPIEEKGLREGIFRVGQKMIPKLVQTSVDEWFSQDLPLMPKLKVMAQFCKSQLARYLASLSSDFLLTLNNQNVERTASFRASDALSRRNANSPVSTSSSQPSQMLVSPTATVFDDPPIDMSRLTMPSIVIYMIDPFQVQNHSDMPPLWSYVGLWRCFLEMLSSLPDLIRERIFLQIVPLEQVLELGVNTQSYDTGGCRSSEIQGLALSVYSRCRDGTENIAPSVKSLTTFGMASARENMVRKRKAEGSLLTQEYVPPFILAQPRRMPNKDISTAHDLNFAKVLTDANVLFCCYCLSKDKKWLLVNCIDQTGELAQSCTIKIKYPANCSKRRSTPWIASLRKLWMFLMDVISFSLCSWRIVISRLGIIGRGELKDMYEIVRKELSLAAPAQLARRAVSPHGDACVPCAADRDRMSQCAIHSVTLTTFRTDPSIHVIPPACLSGVDTLNSRIFVTGSLSANRHATRPKFSHGRGDPLDACDKIGVETTSLLSSSFDDENDHDPLKHLLPSLSSPSENTLFHAALSSPQSDLSKSLLSPSAGMPSALSPFQPIVQKASLKSPCKNFVSYPVTTDLNELLSRSSAVGYLVSGACLDSTSGDAELSSGPRVLQVDLRFHLPSLERQPCLHPLDSLNDFEVMKFLLEQLDLLSWLTVDPSTGNRRSCLPAHISTLMHCRDIFAYMSL